MNLLLSIDDSSCSDAAVAAVIDNYSPGRTSVRVLHVVEWPHNLPPQFTFVEGPEAGKCIVEIRDRLRDAGNRIVARAVSELRAAGFETTSVVVEGDACHAIIETASAWPADTIVLGSHGLRGIDRVLLGSVSEGVVRHAPCSVLVVRGRR